MLSELATDTIVEIINNIIDNIDNKNVNEKNIYILIRLLLGGKFSDNPERTDYFINCWCWFHHFHYDNCKKINYNHQKMYKAMVRKALLSIL